MDVSYLDKTTYIYEGHEFNIEGHCLYQVQYVVNRDDQEGCLMSSLIHRSAQ